MPHVPISATENFLGKSKSGLYGDVIEELDWSMGEVLSELKELGLFYVVLIGTCNDYLAVLLLIPDADGRAVGDELFINTCAFNCAVSQGRRKSRRRLELP